MVHIKDVTDLYNQLLSDYNTEQQKNSEINRLEQEILHYVEMESFNAAQGSQLMKKLKEVRRARRENKYKLQELKCLVDRLEKAKLNEINLKAPDIYSVKLDTILNKIV